jgi:hypothetical protein
MPKKLANLVIMALTGSNCNVKIQGHLKNYFKVKKGPYDNSAEYFFLEKALRNIEIKTNRTIFNRAIQYLVVHSSDTGEKMGVY